MSEQFAYLMPFKRHVTFGFYHGAELPDPAGLLGGPSPNRGAMRSLRLTAIDEVERPELRALVRAATQHRVPPPRGERHCWTQIPAPAASGCRRVGAPDPFRLALSHGSL